VSPLDLMGFPLTPGNAYLDAYWKDWPYSSHVTSRLAKSPSRGSSRFWSFPIPIPKRSVDINHPKIRPICLLDDVSKFFERILNRRLKAFMETLPLLRTPSLILVSGMQYGFTEGLSMIDALDAVTEHIRNKTRDGKVVLAISLDKKRV